ncbi:MAG: methyltransferase domain-containing protein [Proteobacteria bacterium]|nr:methyltransferase domain-containing protein [Pseudomonadota bacterium]
MRRPPHWRTIRAAYDQAAEGYDDRHGDRRSRARFRIIDAPQLDIVRSGRVLEIGCGTGRLLSRSRARTRIGIDLSPLMLRHTRARGIDAVCGDGHALPFASTTFDAIIAGKGTFRYLDYQRAFAECARVLIPGGRLAVHQYAAHTWSALSWLRPTQGAPRDALHINQLDELCAPARNAGLALDRVYLWRSVRIWPYAVPVPPWLPGCLWSHCVVVFGKPVQ